MHINYDTHLFIAAIEDSEIDIDEDMDADIDEEDMDLEDSYDIDEDVDDLEVLPILIHIFVLKYFEVDFLIIT